MAMAMNLLMNSWIVTLVVIGAMIASSHPIFINLSKVNGKIPFTSTSVALMIELAKIFISLSFLLKDIMQNKPFILPSIELCFLYGVPSLLYCINNNLVTHAQLYMDPASFTVMSNLKIATTAIFYKFLINKDVSRNKWIAVFLLFLAGIVNSLGSLQKGANQENELYVTASGVYLVLLYCLISGLAGVYTEVVLKKYKDVSIHSQNLVLYIFGVVLNGFFNLLNSDMDNKGFFEGHSIWTFLIITTQAVNGIIISLVMKYSSSLTRLVMIGISIILSTVLSFFIFGYALHVYFICSFILTAVSLMLYAT